MELTGLMPRRLASVSRFLAAVFCFVLAPAAAAHQTDWTWRNPAGLPYSLFSVAYADASRGAAVGEHGALLATVDGGQSWMPSPSESEAGHFIEKVRFRDGAHGLAVGGNPAYAVPAFLGFVLATRDGGATWETRATMPNTLIYDVWLDGAAGAMAVGIDMNAGHPVVLRSQDDGTTWTAHVDESRFGLLTGITQSVGGRWVVVGTDFVAATGLLLTSDDAGKTWDARDAGGVASLNGVRFRDADRGVAVGEAGSLLVTDDGGTNWAVQATPTALALLDGGWNANGALFVVGGDFAGEGIVASLSGQGAAWSTSKFAASLHGIAFPAAGEITVAGSGGNVFTSHDEGLSWESHAPRSTSGEALQSVSFADRQVGIAVGTNGAALRTANGGSTWSALASGTEQVLQSVSMMSRTAAVAVGFDTQNSAPIIIGTDDGGASWTDRLVVDGDVTGLRGVSCTPARRCVAVGYCGVILRSDDAGGHWSVARPPLCGEQVTLQAVALVDDDIGFVAGQYEIWRTVDGGLTWAAAKAPTDQALSAVSCVDAQHCFIVGGQEAGRAVVLATVDGGASWSLLHEDLPSELQAVDFVDTDHGYATAIDGTIYATADAGVTWMQDAQIGGNLYGVFAHDAHTVTVVGYANRYAAILQRGDGIFADGWD
ncbi:MAG: WD40/YVTN/BNR-like repeat-containing protein [Dokdonella sp.]|uniref:WD40/YVTN/BNR-like repeat-containing protein n=1 Tax=Dokdonella sp. TaxID=2291710 RepID=UPI003F80BA02